MAIVKENIRETLSPFQKTLDTIILDSEVKVDLLYVRSSYPFIY